MVLNSQMQGPGGGGSRYMFRRRRSKLRAPAVLIVLAAVGGICWWMIRDTGGTETARAGDDATPRQSEPAEASDRSDPASSPATNELAGFLAPAEPTAPSASTSSRSAPDSTPDSTGRSSAAAGDPALTRATPPESTANRPPAPARQSAPSAAQTPSRQFEQPTAPAVARKIEQGRALVGQGRLVRGRMLLNEALQGPISDADAARVRALMTEVNRKLVFSPLVEDDDPYTTTHTIQPGEYLSTVGPKYDVPWQFLLRINRITDARRVPAHARLKVVQGPFHLVVDKSEFRADLYMENPQAGRMYVRSFQVGLGEYDSTPIGRFVVREHSKLENPEWVNPRTGERFHPNNPENPIGEHWIGLEGADDRTRTMHGYGLHGTIDPQSIGTEASMGCVRFHADDIELLFAMLVEGRSTVTIVP